MGNKLNSVSSVKKKKPAWNNVHIDSCYIESNKRFSKAKEEKKKQKKILLISLK